MAATYPTLYAVPFANTGARNIIPDAASGTNLASFTEGFPPITMIPISSGGIPPEGKDFNGILFDLSQHTVWQNAGGMYKFDATLAAAIGGYSIGMVLMNNAGTAWYYSAINNNTGDFNTNSALIGVSWLPYAGSVVTGLTRVARTSNTVLGVADSGKFFDITSGTFTQTFDACATLGNGWTAIIRNSGTGTITLDPNGSETINGAATLVMKPGTQVRVQCDGSALYTPANSISSQGGGLTGPVDEAKGADIASASTINLTTATGNLVDVTGTTTITAVTLPEGAERTVRFTGILTLTNGASLILPTGANITTAPGDFAIFRGYAGGVVRLAFYQRANGAALTGPPALSLLSTVTASGASTVDIDTTFNSTYDDYIIMADGLTMSAINSAIWITLKIGGSYVTTDYAYTCTNYGNTSMVPVVTIANAAAEIRMMDNVMSATSTDSASFWCYLNSPTNTNIYKQIRFEGTWMDTGHQLFNLSGAGIHVGSSAALTGVRFTGNGATITGTFRLYGVGK